MAYVDTLPRHIRNTEGYNEIPPDLRSVYEAETGQGFNPDIYLIYCPPTEHRNKPVTEKLFYLFDSSLIYVEREVQGLIRKQFQAGHISVIETGHVLLNAWMTIAGRNGNENTEVTIYFNRVCALYFEKIAETLRAMALDIKYPIQYDNSAVSSLQEKNYKYNFVRNIIFEGERPAGYVFQRALTGKRFKIFRVRLINDHVLIRTQNELVQITEGKSKLDRYGIIKTFYRVKFLSRPEISEVGDSECLRLTLSSGAYSRSVLFDQENTSDIIALLSDL